MRSPKKSELFTLSGTRPTFDDAVTVQPVQFRTVAAARPFLMNAKATFRRKALYAMYRDAHRTVDESLFKKYHIRHDITVLYPGTLGGCRGEYVRTIGHTHPAAE